MIILVQARKAYGQCRFYPRNGAAVQLSFLTNTATFTFIMLKRAIGPLLPEGTSRVRKEPCHWRSTRLAQSARLFRRQRLSRLAVVEARQLSRSVNRHTRGRSKGLQCRVSQIQHQGNGRKPFRLTAKLVLATPSKPLRND